MLHAPVDPGAFPPDEQLEVITLATSKTSEHDCVASQWCLDDLAAELVNRHADEAMTRSTIWRILNAADIKPHRSVYWLNSHDPDFDAKAQDICKLYVQAPLLYQHGELVICTDEKTGMQILERKHPAILAQPGKPEKREHEYIRHGARCLIASFVVPTGKVVWDLGVTRTSVDFAAHLAHVASQFTDHQRCHWVLDNLNTHWSLEVCELLAKLNGLPFHKKDLRNGKQRQATARVPHRSRSQACLPLHAQARFVAQPSRTVVRHLGSSLPETRRLRLSPGFRRTLDHLPARPQCSSRPSLPLDLHRPTFGSCHALQPNTPSATIRSSLVWLPSTAFRPIPLPAPPLPPPPN